ncbi:hypothetical protein BT67DRAFT_390652 [Trichocladium antarcticum]|uniref:Circumsporozoite protein n=1 Tax=Trichocladium antarcticum TaxID=1450529 RepID=A0AAN6ZA12_9PEZI|nr:hypothetical protein BT67DRAFT_390652 [Trichocladium antarcticum]
MYSHIVVVAALLAAVDARFGQEGTVQAIISGLGNSGKPGEAPTLAGATPGVLLAGANACAKLELADKIVATLGNDPQVIAGAAALVAAEKNFNPFAVSIPALCSDAGLPATAELRGILPLVDPAVGGADVENANSATSLKIPLNADGLSVAGLASANGFSNFTTQGTDGATGGAPADGNAGNVDMSNGGNQTNPGAAATTTAALDCGTAVTTLTTVVVAGPAATPPADNNNNNVDNNAGALDFGSCVPTIKFVGGLGNRPATEFTFQAIDAKIQASQQEALNPNIITNRICDELTNICAASQAAKDACLKAKADILALGTRDASTAEKWNELLGFQGVDVGVNASV